MSFGNLITAMVTPFTEELELNLPVVRDLTRYLIEEQKTDAILVGGTTGESPTLDHEEIMKLIKVVKEAARGECLIIVGTGSYNTKETIEFSLTASQLGIDGIMVVTPYYNKAPQEGLFNHFSMINQRVDIPTMIYNIPGRTGINLSYELLSKLAVLPNIVALKESSMDFDKVSLLTKNYKDQLTVYSGDDNITLPMLSIGAEGVVSVASHIVGSEIKKMISFFKDNQTEKALEKHLGLLPVFKNLFLTTNPIPIKGMLNIKGFNVGGLRPPLRSVTKEEEEILANSLKELKLI